jgi:hypothetical protein
MVRVLLDYNGKRKFHSLTQYNLIELITTSVQKFGPQISDTTSESSVRRIREISEDPKKLDQQAHLIYFYIPRIGYPDEIFESNKQ